MNQVKAYVSNLIKLNVKHNGLPVYYNVEAGIYLAKYENTRVVINHSIMASPLASITPILHIAN